MLSDGAHMATGKRAPTEPAARQDVGTVREAIRQTKPFRSDGHEALLTLLATSEKIMRPYEQLLGEHDLTVQQFNVLRILRGAGKDGLPTLEIADRMVERTPGITRLIDRIEKKGLVDRVRSPADRRQVRCFITADGLALLRLLDRPISALDAHAFDPLPAEHVRRLIRLLDRVRTGH